MLSNIGGETPIGSTGGKGSLHQSTQEVSRSNFLLADQAVPLFVVVSKQAARKPEQMGDE